MNCTEGFFLNTGHHRTVTPLAVNPCTIRKPCTVSNSISLQWINPIKLLFSSCTDVRWIPLKTSHLVCQINLLRGLKKLMLVPDSTVCCVCLCCQSFVCGRGTGCYWSAWLTSSWCPCYHQATHRSAINPSNVLVLQSASSEHSLVNLLQFTFLASVLMNWVFCWTLCVVAFLANRL